MTGATIGMVNVDPLIWHTYIRIRHGLYLRMFPRSPWFTISPFRPGTEGTEGQQGQATPSLGHALRHLPPKKRGGFKGAA